MALESNLCPPYLASLDFRRRGEGAKKKAKNKRRRERGEKKAKERKKARKANEKKKREGGKLRKRGEENRADQNGGQFVSAQVNEPIHRNGYSSFR